MIWAEYRADSAARVLRVRLRRPKDRPAHGIEPEGGSLHGTERRRLHGSQRRRRRRHYVSARLVRETGVTMRALRACNWLYVRRKLIAAGSSTTSGSLATGRPSGPPGARGARGGRSSPGPLTRGARGGGPPPKAARRRGFLGARTRPGRRCVPWTLGAGGPSGERTLAQEPVPFTWAMNGLASLRTAGSSREGYTGGAVRASVWPSSRSARGSVRPRVGRSACTAHGCYNHSA